VGDTPLAPGHRNQRQAARQRDHQRGQAVDPERRETQIGRRCGVQPNGDGVTRKTSATAVATTRNAPVRQLQFGAERRHRISPHRTLAFGGGTKCKNPKARTRRYNASTHCVGAPRLDRSGPWHPRQQSCRGLILYRRSAPGLWGRWLASTGAVAGGASLHPIPTVCTAGYQALRTLRSLREANAGQSAHRMRVNSLHRTFHGPDWQPC